MFEVESIKELPADFPNLAVAIGKFDGLHLGHRQLIHELVDYAQESNLAPCVISFDRHPNQTLRPGEVPAELLSPERKAQILEQLGIEALVSLRFDEQLANTDPLQFVTEQLGSRVQMVFVGEGFRFGAGGRGGAQNGHQAATARVCGEAPSRGHRGDCDRCSGGAAGAGADAVERQMKPTGCACGLSRG